MRISPWLLVAALTAVPATVQAQTVDATSHWIAAGFVGSDFGTTEAIGDDASIDYGASLGYLWRGAIGGELLGHSTPDFALDNALFVERPMLNTYMANVIGAVPFGADGQWQPFISGGFGAIQLRQEMLNLAATDPLASATMGDAVKFGGNIGAGVMAYVKNVGFRGDVRYYRTRAELAASPETPADAIADSALSGLDFWRANVGVTVRW